MMKVKKLSRLYWRNVGIFCLYNFRKGIPEAVCSNVFVTTKFWNEANVLRTDPCPEDTTSPNFTGNKFTFKKEITDGVCDYFEKGSMEVELYGARPGTFSPGGKSNSKSLLTAGHDHDEGGALVNTTEKYAVEVEELQNKIISERFNTKQALDSAIDLQEQVDRLKTRIMQSGGTVEDKYKIENESLQREMDVLKAKLDASSKRVLDLEQTAKSSKTTSSVCTIS